MDKWLHKYYQIVLLAILAFAFLTRIYQLHLPERYVFDEVYHAVTAKLINQNDLRAYEWWNPAPEPDTAVDWLHPPLAKYTQALGIHIFGENTFGWRISSVIFGVFVILAVYLLSEELFSSKAVSLGAALLASLDGLLLVQSRVAMNDIHVTFFILLSLLLYLRYLKQRILYLSGSAKVSRLSLKKLVILMLSVAFSTGLAMGSKWSGLFAMGIILVCETVIWSRHLLTLAAQSTPPKKQWSRLLFGLSSLCVFALLPFIIYVFSYAHMFAQGKSLFCFKEAQTPGECYFEQFKWQGEIVSERYISHFAELHRQIWWYQTNLEAEHPFESRPLQWFLNLRPVWYYVEYPGNNTIINIYAQGNPALFWIGDFAVILSVIWLVTQIFSFSKVTKNQKATYWRLLFLIFAYFSVWLPWQLSPRIMFFYHYTPAVPLLCIVLSFWLHQLWKTSITFTRYVSFEKYLPKMLVIFIFVATAICFGVWYSNWVGLSVSQEFANAVYFKLPSWK